MKNQIHQNYIKSSNLAFISAALGIINIFLSPDVFNGPGNIMIGIFSILFVVVIGILIRQGYDWVKFVLLVLLLFGLLGIKIVIEALAENPLVGFINIIQTILQIWSVVLLFQIPKNDNSTSE
jgi:uncharacterized membrane protein